MKPRWLVGVAALAVTGCATMPAETSWPAAGPATADPTLWPAARSPEAITDAATERAIDALIARMTVEQKVGQVIQADISTITPADLARYPLGSILAGGNSGPYGNERASAADWHKLVREFRAASSVPAANGVAVPILFGVDAVHGHNNVPGATLFPHNIGLGATRDLDLIRRIGAVTAAEIAGTGIEWTFAPTLAVPQDPRWGRTYEGYSSDPALVAEFTREMVIGLQGELAQGRPLAADKVAATAKHFLADGGTERGQDQGDARISEEELIRIHAAGYPVAVDAGALTVMASFSSWNGVKHHGNASLLTDVLKGRMGFAGLVVGDWNGHGQVAGCEATNCPQALNAGLDLYMAPDSWKGLYDNLLAQVRAGEITPGRLDDAVRRNLRVKFKLGLMDGQPDDRGNHAVVGAPEHLAVAREAVAKSLVLLKNEGSTLPIRPGARVLVTGPGADSMAMQSGGWTVSWQGNDVTKADFPNGQTIWEGLRDAVAAAGARVCEQQQRCASRCRRGRVRRRTLCRVPGRPASSRFHRGRPCHHPAAEGRGHAGRRTLPVRPPNVRRAGNGCGRCLRCGLVTWIPGRGRGRCAGRTAQWAATPRIHRAPVVRLACGMRARCAHTVSVRLRRHLRRPADRWRPGGHMRLVGR